MVGRHTLPEKSESYEKKQNYNLKRKFLLWLWGSFFSFSSSHMHSKIIQSSWASWLEENLLRNYSKTSFQGQQILIWESWWDQTFWTGRRISQISLRKKFGIFKEMITDNFEYRWFAFISKQDFDRENKKLYQNGIFFKKINLLKASGLLLLQLKAKNGTRVDKILNFLKIHKFKQQGFGQGYEMKGLKIPSLLKKKVKV